MLHMGNGSGRVYIVWMRSYKVSENSGVVEPWSVQYVEEAAR